jgi:hypothetical protein
LCCGAAAVRRRAEMRPTTSIESSRNRRAAHTVKGTFRSPAARDGSSSGRARWHPAQHEACAIIHSFFPASQPLHPEVMFPTLHVVDHGYTPVLIIPTLVCTRCCGCGRAAKSAKCRLIPCFIWFLDTAYSPADHPQGARLKADGRSVPLVNRCMVQVVR